jgi:hypothetical protein
MAWSDTAHALVVGIDDYTGPGIRLLPPTVRQDAVDVAGLLADPARCGFAKERVRSLLGVQATGAALRAELGRLRTIATADSTVVVYVSSHGERLAGGDYLIPADADNSTPEQLAATSLPAAEFSALVNGIPADRVLVILDCCHAAGVAGTAAAARKGMTGFGDDLYGRLYSGRGRAVLAACAADETAVVLGAEDQNSLFTSHLLDGLRGRAASDDGLVKIFGLFEYVQLRVTGAYPDQHPVFKADLQTNFAVALNLSREKGVVAREPTAKYRYDACLAHAEEDFDWVADQLVPRLTAAGLRHTVSGNALGQFRVVAVEEAVKKSKYVLPIVSSHFTKDRVAQLAGILGLTQGLDQGVGKVIPVKIGEPDAEVGLALQALVGVDLTRSPKRTESEMDRLLQQLDQDPQLLFG